MPAFPPSGVAGRHRFVRARPAALRGHTLSTQIAVAAAGGVCARNPRGREMGIARKIALTPEGRAHPMCALAADGAPARRACSSGGRLVAHAHWAARSPSAHAAGSGGQVRRQAERVRCVHLPRGRGAPPRAAVPARACASRSHVARARSCPGAREGMMAWWCRSRTCPPAPRCSRATRSRRFRRSP